MKSKKGRSMNAINLFLNIAVCIYLIMNPEEKKQEQTEQKVQEQTEAE